MNQTTKILAVAGVIAVGMSILSCVVGIVIGRTTAPTAEVATAPTPPPAPVAAPTKATKQAPPPEAPQVTALRPRVLQESTRFASLDGELLTEALEQFEDGAEDITFEQLERNATPYLGQPVVFRGQILEIEDDPRGGSNVIVGVRRRWGGWSDPIHVEAVRRPDEYVVARTVVRVYGYVSGSHQHEARPGWNVEMPALLGAAVVDDRGVPRRLSRAARRRLEEMRAPPEPAPE